MDLNYIYEDVEVLELKIIKDEDQYNAIFSFTSKGEIHTAEIHGFRDDLENITALFGSTRIWIHEDEESQLEFGRYTLGIGGESYCEVIFDLLES